MTAYSVLETCIVGAIVLACFYQVLGRFAPRWRVRAQTLAGDWAQAPAHPSWLRKLGSKMAQAPAAPAGGCGSGCGTCGSCAPKADTEVRPIRIDRPGHSGPR